MNVDAVKLLKPGDKVMFKGHYYTFRRRSARTGTIMLDKEPPDEIVFEHEFDELTLGWDPPNVG